MPLNLDDRRWTGLVEEDRALIPLYAPEWSDHNIHDPGIMLIELLAWVTEMDIYQLNRIPESHRRKFLKLVGIRPDPPRTARTVLSFKIKQGIPSAPALPAEVEFSGKGPAGKDTIFRTLDEISVFAGSLTALQVQDENGFQDLLPGVLNQEPFHLLGDDPRPGCVLYLGFDSPLPVDSPVSLFFILGNARSEEKERLRLIEETKSREDACRQPVSSCDCPQELASLFEEAEAKTGTKKIPPHHSVHSVWEFYNEQGEWQPLDPETGHVEDRTRAFTLNGNVLFKVPAKMERTQIGVIKSEFYYVRLRFVYGAYDAAPIMKRLIMNGVMSEQAAPIGALTWILASNVVIEGGDPAPGERMSLRLSFNEDKEIAKLTTGLDDHELPGFLVLDYQPPSSTVNGSLSVEAELVDSGRGKPHQRITLSAKPVVEESFRLYTLEKGKLRLWSQRADFYGSGREDTHFFLDVFEGVVTFGDGQRGRVPPQNAPIIAVYHATRADLGNVEPKIISELADSAHNRAILKGNFDDVKSQLEVINPIPASGGLAAETVDQAAGKALMRKPERAISLEDYEALAKETPGTLIARVTAKANFHPAFPCLKTPGVITLLVLPYLPLKRPMPGRGLREAVETYLMRRRVIGTRLVVAEPTYTEVAVKTQVKMCNGVNRTEVQKKIIERLNKFFHPLEGGPDDRGWPMGRDVFRSEVLQIIDATPAVDYVSSLELMANGGEPQCGNICLGPCGLVAAGEHLVEVS